MIQEFPRLVSVNLHRLLFKPVNSIFQMEMILTVEEENTRWRIVSRGSKKRRRKKNSNRTEQFGSIHFAVK